MNQPNLLWNSEIFKEWDLPKIGCFKQIAYKNQTIFFFYLNPDTCFSRGFIMKILLKPGTTGLKKMFTIGDPIFFSREIHICLYVSTTFKTCKKWRTLLPPSPSLCFTAYRDVIWPRARVSDGTPIILSSLLHRYSAGYK